MPAAGESPQIRARSASRSVQRVPGTDGTDVRCSQERPAASGRTGGGSGNHLRFTGSAVGVTMAVGEKAGFMAGYQGPQDGPGWPTRSRSCMTGAHEDCGHLGTIGFGPGDGGRPAPTRGLAVPSGRMLDARVRLGQHSETENLLELGCDQALRRDLRDAAGAGPGQRRVVFEQVQGRVLGLLVGVADGVPGASGRPCRRRSSRPCRGERRRRTGRASGLRLLPGRPG